jgi:predicted glycosyltransferase
MTARLLIHVQHLLGIGHLKRAALLARAFAEAGYAVDLVSGGMPVASLELGAARLHQLPPARSRDESFSLVDEHGAPPGPAWHEARRGALLALFAAAAPDALIVETYPFGRRALAFELEALIAAARARAKPPLILASVRDILQAPRRPGRAEAAAAVLARDFDLVLVHGDPSFVRLEESFPLPEPLRAMLRYTGFVAPPHEERLPSDRARSGEVLVSAGGGAVGSALVEAAIAARAGSRLGAAPWRILVGANAGEAELAALAARAAEAPEPEGIVVERARPDFARLLADCRVSVSQAGYNTVMDILGARARAVLVPFVGQGESEQSMRAERLAGRGLAHVLDEGRLTPAALAAAIDAADAGPAPAAHGLALGGAAASVEIVSAALARPAPLRAGAARA